MTIVFSNYSPKIHKLGIFVPKFKDFFLHQTLQIKQIRGQNLEGFNFKYDNGFFEFQPENIQIKYFLL